MDPVSAENHQLAYFFRMSLAYGLLTVDSVRTWADGLIEAIDKPDEWMIELAFATPQNVDYFLAPICGSTAPLLSYQLLCALLLKRWKNDQVDIPTVRRIGVELSIDSGFSDMIWGSTLGVLCEEWSEGWRRESEVREFIVEVLTPYSTYVLPSWVD